MAMTSLFKVSAHNNMEIITAKYIASPPIEGIGLLCILLLSLGTSTAPVLIAILLTIGVNINESTNAVKRGKIYIMYKVSLYLVPNNLSPASPKPGNIYASSVSFSSMLVT